MTLRTLCTALALALGAASPVAAQQPQTPLSTKQLAAGRELVTILRLDSLAMAGIQVSLDQQILQNPSLAAYRSTLEQWARSIFSSPEAKDAFAEMYARNFSEEELQAILAFYHTPVGQTLARRQPSLATQGAALGQRLATEHQADLVRMLGQKQVAEPTP